MANPLREKIGATGPEEKLPRTRGQRAVRLLASVLLAGSAVLLALGCTLWSNRLHGLEFVRYWTWCFLLAVLAGVAALWDLFLVRRAYKRRRRELFRQEFMAGDLGGRIDSPPNPPADDR